MSWLDFAKVIETDGFVSVEDWLSAISANPNTSRDALRIAIKNRAIQPFVERGDELPLSLLCANIFQLVDYAAFFKEYSAAILEIERDMLDYLDRVGEHSPAPLGGEAELAERIRAASSRAMDFKMEDYKQADGRADRSIAERQTAALEAIADALGTLAYNAD